jgi:hypothetical protein
MWQSVDGRITNEIDYILSDRRGNIRDIQVATKLKFDTDHRMVWAAVTLDCRRRYFARPRKRGTEKINKIIYKVNIDPNWSKNTTTGQKKFKKYTIASKRRSPSQQKKPLETKMTSGTNTNYQRTQSD